MIERRTELSTVRRLLKSNHVVGIVGARQVGKTTLARELAKGQKKPGNFFDLERPADLARLSEPELALQNLSGLVVLDEIQRRPELFPALRFLVDRPRCPARFLVLGSASPELLKQSSETLAGRIAYHALSGFSLEEVGTSKQMQLWLRGGFPRSYTAKSLRESMAWRTDFVQTFLERDIPQLGFIAHAETLRRFWKMLAHYHGQVWNASEFARSFGVSDHAVRGYLDILTSTFVIRVLQPWTENLKKRQVKAPKVYLADSGLLHTLLGIETQLDLENHPKVGASWEGFMLNVVTARLGVRPEECYFWATHAGAELDLLIVRGSRRLGFEFKRTTAPRVTPSMRSALQDLQLSRLYVVHAGKESFPLTKEIAAISAERILTELKPLR